MAKTAFRSDVIELLGKLGHDSANVYEVLIKARCIIVSSFTRNSHGDIRLDAVGLPVTRDTFHYYADENLERAPADGLGP